IVPGRCACEKEKATRNARSPLNASARRALSAYLQLRPKAQPGESLFLSDRNGAFSPRAVQTLLQRLARRAEIARLHGTPHLVRHYPEFRTIAGKEEVRAPNPFLTRLGAASIRKLTRHSPVSNQRLLRNASSLSSGR